MKKVLIVLALAAAASFALDNVRVEGLSAPGTDDLLQYDDGTPYWIYGGVAYVGCWFDVTDFMPSAIGFNCDWTEWWFYHHSNLPWDTDQISLELWNGDVAMPMSQLTADDATALHYAPVIINYATPVACEVDFWMVSNTTIYSATGYPSALYDAGANWTGEVHTFGSQDWILWDPFIPVGEDIDVFFRADGEIVVSLDSESWGAIKGLYR